MTTPTPTPADMPHAGLSRAEALRRLGVSEGLADAIVAQYERAGQQRPAAPPGALEKDAAEQDVEPVGELEDLAAGLRDALTDEENDAFQAAIRERHEPPAAATDDGPAPAHAPVGLNRYQDIRDRAMAHALRRYELDDQAHMDDEKVIATADRFADWIRRGYHL